MERSNLGVGPTKDDDGPESSLLALAGPET
jgi:hypothetical protein